MRPSVATLQSIAAVTAVALLAAWATACGGTSKGAERGENAAPLVVCTTTMIGDIARAVAGPEFEVRTLFGPDIDPHLFRATRDDVALLMRADVVFHNGFHLEGYLAETLERVAETGTPVVAVAESAVQGGEALRDGDATDPHVWMSAALWARTPAVVAETLAAARPGKDAASTHTTGLETRAARLRDELQTLDLEVDALLAAIPADRRVLVTAHDAFRYFGARHGIEVKGIQGLSTTSEAGLLAIESLVNLVVERNVPAIFFESTVSERNVRAIVEGARARGHELRLGGVLHADAPGNTGSYTAMIRHNAATIAGALAPGDGAGTSTGTSSDPVSSGTESLR